MSLWVDKYRPTSLSKLDYHKELAAHLKKLVSYLLLSCGACSVRENTLFVVSLRLACRMRCFGSSIILLLLLLLLLYVIVTCCYVVRCIVEIFHIC